MNPQPFTSRDWLLCVLSYTARLNTFKAAHHGYDPDEWASIVQSEFEFLADVRRLAYTVATGETP